ncbi:bifunctional diguanylate cyclase/phosphodiesterase [Desulfotalea psychrophila]|uniref:Hypothetical membrane protein n=1 Tax=Desulfotalea psychrophila (strain LSv54 / DSM 12343) TaxID=177439 RepID=Q6AIJ1_DESPS|nr:EAL domain-containing protein [Desulfotalea psychrophila]CAG37839.1 hypothetical membrane protein [Desulfotalea psychrophila LSv54]
MMSTRCIFRLFALGLLGCFFILAYCFFDRAYIQQQKDLASQATKNSLREATNASATSLQQLLQQYQIEARLSQQSLMASDRRDPGRYPTVWAYKSTKYSYFSQADIEGIRAVIGGLYSAKIVPETNSSYVLRLPEANSKSRPYMVTQSSFPDGGYVLSELSWRRLHKRFGTDISDNLILSKYLLTRSGRILLSADKEDVGRPFLRTLIDKYPVFGGADFANSMEGTDVRLVQDDDCIYGLSWQLLALGDQHYVFVSVGRRSLPFFNLRAWIDEQYVYFLLLIPLAFSLVILFFVLFNCYRRKNEATCFLATLEALPFAVMVTDRQKKVRVWNAALEALTGVSRQEVLQEGPEIYRSAISPTGKPLLIDFLDSSPEVQEEFFEHYEQIFSQDDVVTALRSVEFLDRVKTLEVTAKILRSSQGDIYGYMETIVETTAYQEQIGCLQQEKDQYKRIVDVGIHGFWEWNLVDESLFISAKAKKMIGYEEIDFNSSIEAWWDLVHPEDYVQVVETNRSLSPDSPSYDIQYRILHRDGHYCWLQSRALGVWQDGELLQIIGSHTDVSQRRKREHTLQVLYQVSMANYLNQGLGRYLEAVHEAIASYSQVNNFYVALWRHEEKAFEFVYYRDERESERVQAQYRINSEDFASIPGLSGYVMRRGSSQIFSINDVEMKTCIGVVPASWLGVPLMLGNVPIGIFAIQDYQQENAFDRDDVYLLEAVAEQVVRAIERDQVYERLLHQANHDNLTGLVNRQYFLDWGEKLFNPTDGERRRHALLMLDLNRFKQINDSLGHNVGDRVLVEVVVKIRSQLRELDLLARLGGDEFAIILEDIVSPAKVVKLVASIIKSVEAGVEIDGRTILTGVSVGLVMDICQYDNIHDVLRYADIAMYEAKYNSPKYFRVFNQKLHSRVRKTIEIEQILTNEFDPEELVVQYQPIIDLEQRRLAGFEALVRWQNPRLGYLFPDQFLPVAEEIGIISKIDEAVLELTCANIAQWRQQTTALDHIRVSVNLSQNELVDLNLAQRIIKTVERYGLKPSDLAIEVTESALMSNVRFGKRILMDLRESGIGIHIDDFGTGYSSFGHLADLPFDVLKVDKSFLLQAHESVQRMTVLEALVRMSKSLEIPVVVEGVEEREHLDLVCALGCRYGQGYHFAKPIDRDKVVDFAETFSFA